MRLQLIIVALQWRSIHAIFGQHGHSNSNCQQIKTGGEKSLQMFPGNRNISKWLKLQCWGNSSAGGLFAWNSDFDVYVQTSSGVYEPWKHTKHFFLSTIKQILSLQGVIYFLLCPELNRPQKMMLTSVLPNLWATWKATTTTKKKYYLLKLHTNADCIFSHFRLAVPVFSFFFLPVHAC